MKQVFTSWQDLDLLDEEEIEYTSYFEKQQLEKKEEDNMT